MSKIKKNGKSMKRFLIIATIVLVNISNISTHNDKIIKLNSTDDKPSLIQLLAGEYKEFMGLYKEEPFRILFLRKRYAQKKASRLIKITEIINASEAVQ